MPHVTVRINNRSYDIACGAGEEERLRVLAGEVDSCVVELRRQIGSAPEAMLLLLSALTMADKAREAVASAEPARLQVDAVRAELAVAQAEMATLRTELADSRAALSEIESRLMDVVIGGEPLAAADHDEAPASGDARSPLEDLFSGLETRIETISRKIASA